MDEMRQLVARARVIDELMAEGVNVALPVGACDIDLLAFVECGRRARGLVFVPIRVIGLDEGGLLQALETACGPHVLIALVWDVNESAPIRSFALTAADRTVLKMINVIAGANERTNPRGAQELALQNAIQPFAISSGRWREKLMSTMLKSRP